MLNADLWNGIPHLVAVAEFLVLVVVGEIVTYLFYRLLSRLAARTKTTIDDRVIRATKRLVFFAVLLASLHAVLPSLELPYYSSEVCVVLYYALLVTLVVIAVRVAAIALDEALVKIGIPAEKKNMMVNVVKFVILALGFIGILSDYLSVAVPFFLSLGIIGFALTFSLQYPLANFIGWVYIMVSNIFKVGDRVKIGESYGDVSSINYLTTRVIEVDEYGMLSGRVLTVPNSMALSASISNWVNPPTLWDAVPFTLAYESDLRRVEEIMLKALKELYEERKLVDAVKKAKRTHEETASNREEAKSEPRVIFEPVEGGWISAKLVYLTPLKIRYEIKAALTRRILGAFNAEPERIKFPAGRSR